MFSLTLVQPLAVSALEIDREAESTYLVAQKTAKAVVDYVINWDELDLTGVDPYSLSISNPIPTYELIDGSLSPLNVYYYPVLEGEEIIAFSLAYEFNDDIIVQLTTALAEEVNNYMFEHSEIALIFDEMTIYATDGSSLELLITSREESFFANAKMNSLLFTIDCSPIESVVQLEYEPMPLDAPVYHHLDVPFKANSGDVGVCWACCTASVGQYLTGIDFEGYEISEKFKGSPDVGGTNSDIVECLKKYYGLNYEKTDALSARYFYFSTVAENIYAGYPVIAALDIYGSLVLSSHNIVLRGFWTNTTTKYCSVMNPNIDSKTQIANVVTVLVNNQEKEIINYVMPYSGKVMTVATGIATKKF